jgi:hypothetical protein
VDEHAVGGGVDQLTALEELDVTEEIGAEEVGDGAAEDDEARGRDVHAREYSD